ncbi:MAG: 1-deoxy-D-xylulose-5-phosphate reductoisomerase, partial [Gammaproteobacteria bacterium]
MRKVSIIGSTGTIGVNTLDVIRAHPEQFQVFALTANTQVERLYQQCLEFKPQYAVMRDINSANRLREQLSGYDIEVLDGSRGLDEVAGANEVDTVMCAIVGAAGLNSTLAAAKGGKNV